MYTTAQLIKHYRELLELNQSELARRVGVTPQAVQHWEQHNSNPRPSLIPKIAQVLGVEPRDLAQGAPLRPLGAAIIDVLPARHPNGLPAPRKNPSPLRGNPQDRDSTVTLDQAKFTKQTVSVAGNVHIRRLQTNGGEDKGVDLIVVSPDWVARWLPGRNPEAIGLLSAYGDAMAPTLSEGSLVFVDTSKTVLDYDAVWVLKHRTTKEIWIRRVQRRPDGSWALLYDNPRYESVVVPFEDRTMFDVLGQVAMRGALEPM